MCPINIILFCFYSVSFLCLFCVYIPATTPRATTPHLYRTGYHAFTTTAQLSRLCISRLPRQGLPRPIFITTCYHTRQSSSYFIVYLSPAFTPPFLLHLHHHRAPHATTYSTSRVCAPGTIQQLLESLVSLTHKQSVCTGYLPATPLIYFCQRSDFLSASFLCLRGLASSPHIALFPIFTLR